MSSSLELPARPHQKKPSKARRYALIAAAVVLPLSWIIWYVNTPPELPVSANEISGTGVAGTPLYVGMFSAPSGFDRTLHMSGVKVRTTANTKLEVTPLLCRGASVGVTTQPEQFCKELVNPEGQEFGDGDSIMVRIESEKPAVAVINRIRIGFRQDIRWATQEAGASRAIVTIFTRS